MRTEQIAALISRGVGLALLVFGISTALYWLPLQATAKAGWTSYPPTSATSAEDALHDTYYVIGTSLGWWYLVPSVGQAVVGGALMVFSRTIGRVLATGLRSTD